MAPAPILIALANRCLREDASRELDASIYCAILGLKGACKESSVLFDQARARGRVFLSTEARWLDAPPYTADIGMAKTLVPMGLGTISPEARIVCATALFAIAILDEPPVLWATQVR